MALSAAELDRRLRDIQCIALDVDGVLTDGRLFYLPGGTLMPSGFHVHDGMAIRVAIESGLKVVMVSGNQTEAVQRRAEHLKVTASYLGTGDKVTSLRKAARDLDVPLERFGYMGDDMNDLAAMRLVGLSVAVADAVEETREAAGWVTSRPGGAGAVREFIRLVLTRQGLWEQAMARFLADVEANGFLPGKGGNGRS